MAAILMNFQALDLLPDPVFVVDEEGIIQFANDECHRFLGKKDKSLISTSIDDLVPMNHEAHAKLRIGFMKMPVRRPLSNSGFGKFKILHHNGETIAVDISLNPFQDQGKSYVMVALRDIRSHMEMINRINLLSAAVDSAACGVLITDQVGHIIWSNPMTSTISGYDQHELVGQHSRIFKSNQHSSDFYQNMWMNLNEMKIWQGIVVNRHKEGHEYYEELTLAPIQDTYGKVNYFMAIKQDVSERIRLEKQLAEANKKLHIKLKHAEEDTARLYEEATRDKLSGVFNRRYFEEACSTELSRAKRSKTTITLVMIDIDFFKMVNDTYGHDVGDKVIALLGGLLLKKTRPYDSVCRYGGEEFVVILPNTSSDVAKNIAETWRVIFESQIIAYENKTDGTPGTFNKTLSAGIAQWNGDEDLKQTLARADAALYIAKHSGRNQIRVAD